MSNHWGHEKRYTGPKKVVVFSTSQNLLDWIRDGRGRVAITWRNALEIFKFNQKFIKQFAIDNLDKELVEFDEIDELRKIYIKKSCHALENYIK
jgi:hypothetical protein